MAGLHLVTGFKGTAHVTSADQGAFNAGCVGVGDYVLQTGTRFNAQAIEGNVIRIFDGDLSLQGRHVTLASGTFLDIQIANGETSKNRNDLIVVRYEKNTTTGVESVEFAVKQGTATTETASDPTYTKGNILAGATVHEMPLYRVRLSGLTVSSIEPVHSIVFPMNDIQHKLYHNNLLINGDFTCNQRGKTTYEVGNDSMYSVDMWRIHQLKLDVLQEGVRLERKSSTALGYFTQFIQLGVLKTTTYVISAKVNGLIYNFGVTPGAEAKEKNFGTFKISALTTSTWDEKLNGYNNKLKVNICPITTNPIIIEYVDVFEGGFVYPHIKEDAGTALMRCRRYIQKGACVTPTLYEYMDDAGTAMRYRIGIPFEPMASEPSFIECNWSTFAGGDTMSGTVDDIEYVGKSDNLIQIKTDGRPSRLDSSCYGFRVVYILSCEPSDA